MIYTEGEPCHDNFCLLLSGKLEFIQDGTTIGSLDTIDIFGEVGLFVNDAKRTATVKVASGSATYLCFNIDREELKREPLKELDRRLSIEAWIKIVSDNKSKVTP